MIPVRTVLRTAPAAWFALPITLLAAWYATLLSSPPGYSTAATAAASGAMPLIGAFVGATAAWEGARLRRGAVWGGPWSRSPIRIAAGVLIAPIVAGLIAAAGAIVVAQVAASAYPPDLVIAGVLILDVFAYASVGFALGVLVPPALAIPIAAVVPLLWLAFIPAIHPVWLRHLTGMYRDCCSLEEALAPQAVAASVVLDAAIVGAAAVACIVRLPRINRAIGVVGIIAAAAVVGGGLASGLTYAPVVARDASVLSCESDGGVTACVWPEHAADRNRILTAVSQVRSRWLELDIDAPSTFTEASHESASGSLEVHLPDPLTDDGVILALASAMLPPLPHCGAATTGGIAIPYLMAWYAAAGGLSPVVLQGMDAPGDGLNPSVLTEIDQLRRADASTRREWMARAAAIAQTCDEVVPDLRLRP